MKQQIRIIPALVCLLMACEASAVTINLTGAGGNGGGYGNSLDFTAGGIDVNASSYAETGAEQPPGSSYYLFQTAEVYSWSTGIGSCNRQEGSVAGNSCNDSEHEVDTVNRDDLVVFQFNQLVDFEFLSVDPYDGSGSDPNDRNIIYWIGNSASLPDLTSATFSTLALLPGFGAETESAASSSYSPYTHALSGVGNFLLLAGDYHDQSCKTSNVTSDKECEAYKIRDITVSAATPVPVPAALYLLGSGLLGLGVLRRRAAPSRKY